MSEFDKKVDVFLEKHTENFIVELQNLEKNGITDYRVALSATLASSLNFTKELLRNYHEELLEYLEHRKY